VWPRCQYCRCIRRFRWGRRGAPPRAYIDGTGPGWRTLTEADFADVNGNPETWEWKNDLIVSTGLPIGVMRTQQKFTNFELVIEWRHLRGGGEFRRVRSGCLMKRWRS
jgi:hypothetical protein